MGLRGTSSRTIKFLAYGVVVVLANMVGLSLFARVDLTKDKLYSISEASREVVSTLSEPLTIKVFFTKNLPAPHNNTERYLHDLLGEYSQYANRYFNYRFYDVSPEEGDITEEARENQKLARNYGIFPVQIRAIEKDEVKFRKAYMGLVLIHGDLMERIPTITSTEGLEYELTMAIQKLNNKISALLALEDKIRIQLFLSSSLEAVAPYVRLNQLPQLPEKLESIVRKLNDTHYGKLAFEYLDPSKEPALREAAKSHNVMDLRWPALDGGKIEAGEGNIGLVMTYGEKAITVPLLRIMRLPLIGTQYELVDMNRLEETLAENVESLIHINEDIGYLADHGTQPLKAASPSNPRNPQEPGALKNFTSLISDGYSVKSVNLEDEPIPDSFNCLIIEGPKERFSDYALFQIDQFLMRGNSLALFLDRFQDVEPSGQNPQGARTVLLETGLEKLLDHYGIRIKNAYVMDENCFKQRLPSQFGGGERAIYFAPIIKSEQINNGLAFMKPIKGLVVYKISPLELDTKRIGDTGVKATRLFSSSERSWEMTGRINLNPMLIRPPESADAFKTQPLAYVLEGEFRSYFEGKDIPEKPQEQTKPGGKEEIGEGGEKPKVDLSQIEGEGEFISKGKRGRIFLMASSEVLKDNMMDASGRSPNAMFILNLIDYLNDREDVAVMRSKVQRFNPLLDTGSGTKTFVKSFNIVGLPVLVVCFGLGVWFRRHSRKRRIQMMFEK
ncbi:MAG: Gldg family protein [Deltaproteobacteria bacterium]|jgi:ABC-2 type transport system permease protein